MNIGFARTLLLSLSGVALTVANAQQHEDLGDFKQCVKVPTVWMATVFVDVSVNPEYPVQAKSPGRIEWLAETGEAVKENQCLGYMAADKLDVSKRGYELKKAQYANSMLDIENKLIESKKALDASISEIDAKLEKMKLSDEEKRILGAEFARKLQEEAGRVAKDAEFYKEKKNSGYFDDAAKSEIESLNLELERSRLDHEDQMRSSRLLAGSDGVFTRLRDTSDGADKEEVAGKVVARGVAEARLEVVDETLLRIEPEKLELRLGGDDGKAYVGTFDRQEEEVSLRGNAKVYVFKVVPVDGGECPGELNGPRMARVNRKLDKPGWALKKENLLFKFPDEISSRGWSEFIESRWQGVRVRLVAPKVVILDREHEN